MRKAIITATCAISILLGAEAQVAEIQSVNISLKNGEVRSFAIKDIDSISYSTSPSLQGCKWYQTLENPGIADYLRDFEYDANDYSYHKIFDYRGEPYYDERQDWPYGVTLGDTTYYNLIPGQRYRFQYVSKDNSLTVQIQTLGQLRMIKTEGIDNVRDLGGWPTVNGHSLRYGKVFRGTEMDTKLSDTKARRSAHVMTAADLELLKDQLRIQADLDLRGEKEIPHAGCSPLGEDIAYANYCIQKPDIEDKSSQAILTKCLRFIIEQLKEEHAIYIHCVWGADRTGFLCMLLEGLLGVSQSNMDKDYELTSFSGNTRYRTNSNHRGAMNAVLKREGETIQGKFRNWWLEAGMTEAELDEFSCLMLE